MVKNTDNDNLTTICANVISISLVIVVISCNTKWSLSELLFIEYQDAAEKMLVDAQANAIFMSQFPVLIEVINKMIFVIKAICINREKQPVLSLIIMAMSSFE